MRRAALALRLAPTLALGLAACATERTPGVQVTRFHLAQPIARGQIAVEPLGPVDRGSLEFQAYASAVGAELARVGFVEAPGLTASEQVAAIGIERGQREGPPRSSPLQIGIGGGSFGYRGGAGGGVSFPVGRSRPNIVDTMRLTVQIKRRSDGSTIWEGRAEGAARDGTPEADPQALVRRLAQAMFVGFPGESGRTVIVK